MNEIFRNIALVIAFAAMILAWHTHKALWLRINRKLDRPSPYDPIDPPFFYILAWIVGGIGGIFLWRFVRLDEQTLLYELNVIAFAYFGALITLLLFELYMLWRDRRN